MMETATLTRRERRAVRQRRLVTATEARLAARLAHLDYKVSGETGAMRVPAKGRTWHRGNRRNGHAPPPDQGWGRSGPTYVVEADGLGRLPQPVVHHRWRRQTANRRKRPQTNRPRPDHGRARKREP